MRRLLCLFTALSICIPAWSQSASFNMIKLSQNFTPNGDFNNDGREDGILFTQTPNAFHAEVSTGTGTYTELSSYALPNNEGEQVYAVGDFNRDGKLDVAIVTSAKKLYVYPGTGTGKFNAPVTTSLTFLPSGIAVADVNHDGKMDLVLVNGTNSTTALVTYFGNGSGGFTAGPSSDFGGNYNLLGVGDFDGDGKGDVFSANCGPGGCVLWVYYGDGAGRFGSPTSVGSDQGGFVVADLDADGRSDIIAANTGYINGPDRQFLTVFYGTAARTLLAADIPTSLCTTGQPAVADFNGDGIPDIVFTEHTCSQNSFTEPSAPAQIAFLPGHGNRAFGNEQALFNSTYGQQQNTVAHVLRGNNSDTKPDFMFDQYVSTPGGATETILMVNSTSGAFGGCRPPNSATGFRICTPLSGASVTSPVKFSFGAAWQVPVRKTEVWVDGVKKVQSRNAFSDYGFLDANLTMSPGTHVITIDSAGWDNSTQSKKYSITVH
jgi:hypothetical protein